MCVCTSIKPGRQVAEERSIAETPAGSFVDAAGPTAVIASGVVEDDDLIGEHVARSDVEQLAATHGAGRGVSERNKNERCQEGRAAFCA